MHGPNIVVDLRDILTEILHAWKKVIALAVLIAVAMTALLAAKARSDELAAQAELLEAATADEEEEEIPQTREALFENYEIILTTHQKEEVKSLLAQMNAYKEYKKAWQDEFSGYMAVYSENTEDRVLRRSSYRLTTSLEGAETLMSSLAVNIDDYRKIMELLPGVDTLSSAYKYVFVGTTKNEVTTEVTSGESADVRPDQILVRVEILGENQEICDKVWEIVDKALKRETNTIHDVDNQAKITLIDTQYSGNINNYIIKKQQETYEMIKNIDAAISTLQTNFVNKLTGSQKGYYKLLLDEERATRTQEETEEEGTEEEETEKTFSSYITSGTIAIGIIAGLILACVFAAISFIMSGKVKSANELETGYGLSILNNFFVKDKRGCLFPGLVRKLHHADTFTQEALAAMVAADVCGSMENEGTPLYMIRTCDSEDDKNVTDLITNAVQDLTKSENVVTGSPLENAADVQALTKQKNSILVVHAKKTALGDVEKILDLCHRHSVEILGTVVLTEI